VTNGCSRAEILAGAIALGEATEAEREEYRNHISTCASCLAALGGEREIERVMATVAQARDAETWEPIPRRLGERTRARMRVWSAGAAVLAAAVALSFGVHVLLATAVRAPSIGPEAVAVEHATPFHVTLERRPHVAATAAPVVVAKATPSPPSMVVTHTVIERHGNKVTQTTTQTTTTQTEVAEAPIPQVTAPASNVPIWRRDEAMPVEHAVTAQQPATAAPVLGGRAESMAVTPVAVVHDVLPLGGDAAIKPQIPAIAYAEGAQGTTAFEVQVDERGNPVKCTITKKSGYLALDNAVCKAAMAARYSPRTVNGKAVLGLYRDAFTFRPATDEDTPQP
jgi:TonB family protein